jgi:hypothetical protein
LAALSVASAPTRKATSKTVAAGNRIVASLWTHPLHFVSQDQLPGRLPRLQTTEGHDAGPVNCIRSFGGLQ